MTIAEGGGRRALGRKFRDVYLPTLKANFVLWPAVQILNFRVVPIQFQIVSPTLGTPERAARTRANEMISLVALCIHHWYRLDCVPLPDQLVRR